MTRKERPIRGAGPIRALAAAGLALCLVVDPTAGSFIGMNIQKAIVRRTVDRHILAGIEGSDLVVLQFSRSESQTLLRWEHPREFEYDGQMYDIVETWTVGDTIYYRCWWDREETALNSRMRLLALRALGDAPRIGDCGDPRERSDRPSSCVLILGWTFPTPAFSDSKAPDFTDRHPSVVIPPPTPPPRPA